MAYLLNVLIAIDQVGTALLGGYPDETMSSYAYRLKQQGKRFGFMADVIDTIFLLLVGQHNHCFQAYLAERKRTQFPPALR